MADAKISITIETDASTAKQQLDLVTKALTQTGAATEDTGKHVDKLDGVLGKIVKTFTDAAEKLDRTQGGLTSLQGSIIATTALMEAYKLAMEAVGKAYDNTIGKVIEFAEGIERTANTAEAIGVTTQKLREMDKAAQLLGVDANTMNGILLMMNRHLGDATTAGGPAAEALGKLGLGARDIMALNPAEQFQVIAQALGQVQDGGVKAQVAMAIFGRGWAELVPLLRDGGMAFDEATGKVKLLYKPLGEDLVQASKDLVDQTRLMKAEWESLSVKWESRAVPVLGALLKSINAVLDAKRLLGEDEFNIAMSGGMNLLGPAGQGKSAGGRTLGEPTDTLSASEAREALEGLAVSAKALQTKHADEQEVLGRTNVAMALLANFMETGVLPDFQELHAMLGGPLATVLMQTAEAEDARNLTISQNAAALVFMNEVMENRVIPAYADLVNIIGDLGVEMVKATQAERDRQNAASAPFGGGMSLELSGSQNPMTNFLESVGTQGMGKTMEGMMGGMVNSASTSIAGATDGLGLGLSADAIGGAATGGIGFLVSLLMKNPKMQEEMGKLMDTLQELITPLVDGISPALDALVPLMEALKPVFVIIGDVLKMSLQPLIVEIGLVTGAIREIMKPINDLKKTIENWDPSGGGNIKTNVGATLGHPEWGFAAGGLVTSDRMLPVPVAGFGARAGLIVAHEGEIVVPKDKAMSNGSSITINVHALDARSSAQQIRQVIEELILTRQLSVA